MWRLVSAACWEIRRSMSTPIWSRASTAALMARTSSSIWCSSLGSGKCCVLLAFCRLDILYLLHHHGTCHVVLEVPADLALEPRCLHQPLQVAITLQPVAVGVKHHPPGRRPQLLHELPSPLGALYQPPRHEQSHVIRCVGEREVEEITLPGVQKAQLACVVNSLTVDLNQVADHAPAVLYDALEQRPVTRPQVKHLRLRRRANGCQDCLHNRPVGLVHRVCGREPILYPIPLASRVEPPAFHRRLLLRLCNERCLRRWRVHCRLNGLLESLPACESWPLRSPEREDQPDR